MAALTTSPRALRPLGTVIDGVGRRSPPSAAGFAATATRGPVRCTDAMAGCFEGESPEGTERGESETGCWALG